MNDIEILLAALRAISVMKDQVYYQINPSRIALSDAHQIAYGAIEQVEGLYDEQPLNLKKMEA